MIYCTFNLLNSIKASFKTRKILNLNRFILHKENTLCNYIVACTKIIVLCIFLFQMRSCKFSIYLTHLKFKTLFSSLNMKKIRLYKVKTRVFHYRFSFNFLLLVLSLVLHELLQGLLLDEPDTKSWNIILYINVFILKTLNFKTKTYVLTYLLT